MKIKPIFEIFLLQNAAISGRYNNYTKQILILQIGVFLYYYNNRYSVPVYLSSDTTLLKMQLHLDDSRGYPLHLRFVWRQSELRF